MKEKHDKEATYLMPCVLEMETFVLCWLQV